MQGRLGITVDAAGSAREAVAKADVVMCATNSTEPVFAREWLEPGMHVSSVARLELDADVVAAADVVFIHTRELGGKTVRTAGADLARETEERKTSVAGSIGAANRPELADLLLGRAPGRGSERDITVFLNHGGIGYQFAAAGQVIYKKARELKLGRELDTDLFTSALPS
jgi:ornithine cyclodeaminase/alanine dehydrogenase-like protein (mu-crystallin family)